MSENATATYVTLVPGDESIELDGWLRGWPDDPRPASLLIADLRMADSPRQAGPDTEHVRMLAESSDPLPPIVVHSQSMEVVDGVHRVRAAVLRGDERIDALLYHGSAADAFVLAVHMNIAHGLPLSRTDRTRAAARIIASHSRWSNRMIASATGLAAGTIAEVRRRSTEPEGKTATRIGRDGRVRPVNGAAGRQRVEELLAAKPHASLRAIAREAGVSPATVCSVRQRLQAGQSPVLDRQLAAVRTEHDAVVVPVPRREMDPLPDVPTLLELLMKDPYLRFSDSGRALLRWLNGHRAGMVNHDQIVPIVPDHCAGAVAKLARGYAWAWVEFANRLEERELPQSG